MEIPPEPLAYNWPSMCCLIAVARYARCVMWLSWHHGNCSFIMLVITVTSQWARWRLKSPASRLFTQPFIHARIKENIKAPRHWTLCGEFTGGPVPSSHKWPVTRKMFPSDDVIMCRWPGAYWRQGCNHRKDIGQSLHVRINDLPPVWKSTFWKVGLKQ